MNLDILGWSIILGMLAFLIIVAMGTRKYVRGVADFVAANRCAGRYLLAIASNEAATGAMGIIAGFEMFYVTGWAPGFWAVIFLPLFLFISLSGFVTYRLRATRSLTLNQFLEMRYSRKVRILVAIIAFVSGMFGMGVVGGVAARFFVGLCNFPPELSVLGVNVATEILLSAVLLFLAVLFTFLGGQIAVIVTDFWQGFFTVFVIVAITIFLWFKFPWEHIVEAFRIVSVPGKSLADPLDIGRQENFNFWFFAIEWFMAVYAFGSRQGAQGYAISATSPHEQKMARIFGDIRGGVNKLAFMLIPIAAIVVMNHPQYSELAARITSSLKHEFVGESTLQRQAMVPAVLGAIFPKLLTAGFTAVVLGFFISTVNTVLHSFASIFVQDIICPLRKTALGPEKHLKLLRYSLVGIAVFAFLWSAFFPLRDYVILYSHITGAIYLAGAGALVIGGLYWKRGTTAGAWAAMLTGAICAITSILLRTYWHDIPWLVNWKADMPVTTMVTVFISAVSAAGTYVLVSLLTRGKPINMDRMLHRGEYAIKEEEESIKQRGGAKDKPVPWYWRMIGVNSHEFSNVDKAVFLYVVLRAKWTLGASLVILIFLVPTAFMNFDRWMVWWRINVFIYVAIALVGGIWIVIGGFFDIFAFYRRLAEIKRNALDDGRVVGEHNLADDQRDRIADPTGGDINPPEPGEDSENLSE